MKKSILCIILIMIMLISIPVLSGAEDLPEKIFDEPKYEYTVTEKEGLVIPIDLKGMPLQYIQHKAANDKAFLYYLDKAGLHILPIQKGKATITLTNSLNKKDKTVITVNVDDSAVYAKNEKSPLRAYIVPDNTVITNAKCTAKYVVLGGSGKYSDIGIDTECITVNGGGGDSILTVKKNTGTYSTWFSGDMNRFRMFVTDSDGEQISVNSPVVYLDKETEVLIGTYYNHIEPGEELHIKYFINGETEPYTVKIDYQNSRSKSETIKNAPKENDLVITAPPYEEYINISVTDKKKNQVYTIIPLIPDMDLYGFNVNAVQVDKPFAQIGDEVHFVKVCKNENEGNTPWQFVYEEADPDNFAFKKTIITDIKETEDGYSLIVDHPGWICMAPENSNFFAPMVKVIGN